jgi:hypothetical protein
LQTIIFCFLPVFTLFICHACQKLWFPDVFTVKLVMMQIWKHLSDLNNINLWCQEWELELNLSECTSVHFVQKLSNQHHTYTVNGINIKTSEKVTYLGVTLTSDLSWGKHIRNICGTALKKRGIIKLI